MISPEHKKRILDCLWPHGESDTTAPVYALLDGARDTRVEPMIRLSWYDYTSLFSGTLSPQMAAASPYLVQLSREGRFIGTLLDQTWGLGWGYFVVLSENIGIMQLRRHFRRFLQVQDEAGRNLLFRFYDPRVLSLYLPTCTTKETKDFFGPVRRIVMEDARPGMLRVFSLGTSGVSVQELSLDGPQLLQAATAAAK